MKRDLEEAPGCVWLCFACGLRSPRPFAPGSFLCSHEHAALVVESTIRIEGNRVSARAYSPIEMLVIEGEVKP